MALKVLIVPDKFKGTLTAGEAAKAIARGWRKVRRSDSLELLPMSDGGDGFGEVLSGLLGAKRLAVRTVDAAHRPIEAYWWWEPGSRTAIIESANIIGLARLPAGRFHPFELDTFGLGAVIRAAHGKGARRCFIGIGGSATSEGGFGVARAVGWEFFDRAGERILHWTELNRLGELRKPGHSRWFEELIVAVDVQNPLLGRRGAVRVYGPQKGLTPDDFPLAERCLRALAAQCRTLRRKDIAKEPGAGAAGGLGFGLRCFLGARLQPGFELFASKAQLMKRLRGADIVITGEGAIDASTMMGKGTGEIAARCAKLNIPCIGLAGIVNASPDAKHLFSILRGLTELTDAGDARKRAAFWLEKLAEKIAREVKYFRPAQINGRPQPGGGSFTIAQKKPICLMDSANCSKPTGFTT